MHNKEDLNLIFQKAREEYAKLSADLTIKKVLKDLGIEYLKIYLFGSRAKGSYNIESDWDYLIMLTANRPCLIR